MKNEKLIKIWTRHVEAWRSSKLSQSEYYKLHNLKTHSLSYWHRKMGAKKKEPRFLPVIKEVNSDISIETPSGVKLSISAKTDPTWLAALLRKLA